MCYWWYLNTVIAIGLIISGLIGSWLGIVEEAMASFYILTGLLIFHFGIPAITVGWANLRDIDLKGMAIATLYIGIFIWVYVPFYIMLNMYWFAINCASWSWVILLFVLVVYEKVKPAVMGWTFIIESIYTTFIPAAILMLGLPLP